MAMREHVTAEDLSNKFEQPTSCSRATNRQWLETHVSIYAKIEYAFGPQISSLYLPDHTSARLAAGAKVESPVCAEMSNR